MKTEHTATLTAEEWLMILAAIDERLEFHDEFVDQDSLDKLEQLQKKISDTVFQDEEQQ